MRALKLITLFNVNGALIYVDEKGDTVGYEDVFAKIEMCPSASSSDKTLATKLGGDAA
jgi:hypothetical protein